MANVYAALVQQVFDVARREWEADIHHHGELANFGRGFKITKLVLAHEMRLGQGFVAFKPVSADNTI